MPLITAPMCSRPSRLWLARPAAAFSALLVWVSAAGAETFRVATYNAENYLDEPAQSRPVKSLESKAKVRESIRALKPDVLALQEMGSLSAVQELRNSLKTEGLDFPYWEFVTGADTNIHIVIFSRFAFTACRPHTNDNFLLDGRRFRVRRGFAEADIRVNRNFSFTLIAAHLKSKRLVAEADQADLRLEEAKLLRETIDARLAANPRAYLVVLGDLNDTKDSPAIKVVVGRGKLKLIDTSPAERDGDTVSGAHPGSGPRKITWTHYFAKEDLYSRIDYILLNPRMARLWRENQSYVLALADWGVGSDHRPVVAAFEIGEK